MAGNQAPDIGQLTKILTIAIVATLILVAAAGILFAVKILTGDNAGPDTLYPTPEPTCEPSPVITPAYTEQVKVPEEYSSGTRAGSGIKIQMPVDRSANDSVEDIGSFIPDDPYFNPPEFNTTSPDYTLTTEYYQVLLEKKYTLLYNSTSMAVTVGKGPLIVGYEVSNFMVTTGSGTGSTENEDSPGSPSHTIEDLPNENPYYSFLDITVTDESTGEIVANGGFGRTHSSNEEQYIMIPMTGEFRIDIYGSGLDMDLRIISGTVPDNPNAIGIDPNMKNKYSLLKSKEPETETTPEIPEELWYR